MAKRPDLQALVEKHGGYDRIPAEAWLAYDRAMARYIAAIRKRPEKK